MSVHFEVAPLIELIAEVRWQPPAGAVQQFTMGDTGQINLTFQPPGVDHDEIVRNFAAAAETIGYRNSERLLPPGMAALPGQPSYRFRKSATDSVVVQIGPGVFSVNAVPPYSSWETFAPQVEEALTALVASRPSSQQGPFVSALVRYIDVFDERFRKGLSAPEFISDVLGFSITSKTSVQQQQRKSAPASLSFQMGFDTPGDLRVQMTVAEGQAGNAQGVILDTTVGRFGELPKAADELFAILSSAHLIVHDMFIDLTRDLADVMRPVTPEEHS